MSMRNCLQVMGIGRPGTSAFYYRVEQLSSSVTATQVGVKDNTGNRAAVIRLPAGSNPISIRSKSEYAYIGSNNSRFGPLVVRTGSRKWVLAKDAQRFIPLWVK